MTDQREKRIQEIRDRLYDTPNRDVGYLLTEVSRLQVERDELADMNKLNDEAAVVHREQRDEAIAELKRFASRDPYATGSSAKRVLSELGVPNDPLD